MRTKLNLDSSSDRRATDSDRRVTDSDRRVTDNLTMSGVPLAGMPLEWLDAGSWRLPSGKALAEFALQAGFLAPPLFDVEKFGGEAPRARVRRFMSDGVMPSEIKHCGKGSGE
jgi:hypothetical protein